jgi:type II secretory pathway component PulJ
MVMSRFRSDSRGFSLMELVWAMALGMIVLLAAFTVIEKSFAANKTITDREDALQRGRQSLELITRQLRSQVCLPTQPATLPITTGGDQTITFYTYLGDASLATVANGQRDAGTNQVYPEQHTISYVTGSGQTGNKITESDAKVTSFNPLTVATAYRTTVLATNVILPDGKLFQYFEGSASGGVSTTALTTPLSTADAASVVQINVNYKVNPSKITSASNAQATTFTDSVFFRSVSPEDTTSQPCDSN